MRRARLLLPIVVALALLPTLMCAALWYATSRPGTARTLALPLPAGREISLYLRPCGSGRAGYVALWYADNTHQNRFITGSFAQLGGTTVGAACR